MKIVGQLVCGPGEVDRFLRNTLEEFKRLCDDVVVVLCNAGPKEKKMIREYDFRSYEDNREWGKFQPYIKTKLLESILLLNPDWILALDADETMPSVTRETLENQILIGRDACFFYVVNLWNDKQHYSQELSFWNIRLYRAGALRGTQFLRKPVHCGNAPPYFYNIPARQSYVPHILLHTGLMSPQDRLRKAERYRVYDPNAEHKGAEYYHALVADKKGEVYNQEDIINKINKFYESFSRKNTKN